MLEHLDRFVCLPRGSKPRAQQIERLRIFRTILERLPAFGDRASPIHLALRIPDERKS
jgi:hypothetical protein